MTIIQVDISDSGAQLLQTTGETAIIYNGVALGSWVTRFSGVGILSVSLRRCWQPKSIVLC